MPEPQFRLAEARVSELIAAYNQTTDGLWRTRLQAVHLYGTGYAVTDIITITQWH